MLSISQKEKKFNGVISKLLVTISKKYDEYKKEKIKNEKEGLKKQNKKIWLESFKQIGLTFLISFICFYIFFSLISSGNLYGLYSKFIDLGRDSDFIMIFFAPPFISTIIKIGIDLIKSENSFFKFKKIEDIILNKEEFKFNYVLNKDDMVEKYKEIENIIGKEELEEIMFKVNRKLNKKNKNRVIDIGAYTFIMNIYEEWKIKINEEKDKLNDVKGENDIRKKLNCTLKELIDVKQEIKTK